MHFDQLDQREVIAFVGGAAAWPLSTQAQQPWHFLAISTECA
jgi:hypothetical protein